MPVPHYPSPAMISFCSGTLLRPPLPHPTVEGHDEFGVSQDAAEPKSVRAANPLTSHFFLTNGLHQGRCFSIRQTERHAFILATVRKQRLWPSTLILLSLHPSATALRALSVRLGASRRETALRDLHLETIAWEQRQSHVWFIFPSRFVPVLCELGVI